MNNPNIPSSTNAEIEEARRLAETLAAPAEHVSNSNLERYPRQVEVAPDFVEAKLSIVQQTLSEGAIGRVSSSQPAPSPEFFPRNDYSTAEIIGYIRQVGDLMHAHRQFAAQNGLPSEQNPNGDEFGLAA